MKKILSIIILCGFFTLVANPIFAARLVKFSWDSNSVEEGVSSYTLYYTPAGGTEQSVVITSLTPEADSKIHYELSDLERMPYCFQLTANNSIGASDRTIPPICAFIGKPSSPGSFTINIEITISP